MPFEDAIDWISGTLFLGGAMAGLFAVYLWLRQAQGFGKSTSAQKCPGIAFDTSTVARRVEQVRKDYLAARSSRPHAHQPGLLKAAAEAVSRLSYFCRTKPDSEDYALLEYGLTGNELDKSFKKVSGEIKNEAKTGKLKKFV